jgi:hypothetical protein
VKDPSFFAKGELDSTTRQKGATSRVLPVTSWGGLAFIFSPHVFFALGIAGSCNVV